MLYFILHPFQNIEIFQEQLLFGGVAGHSAGNDPLAGHQVEGAPQQGLGVADGHDFYAASLGDQFTHVWQDILFDDALDEIPQLDIDI